MFNDNVEYKYIIKKIDDYEIDNDIIFIKSYLPNLNIIKTEYTIKLIKECKIKGLKNAIKNFLEINDKELNILIHNKQLKNIIDYKRNSLNSF